MSENKSETEKNSKKRLDKSVERGKKRLDMVHSVKKEKRKSVRDQYIPDHKLYEY